MGLENIYHKVNTKTTVTKIHTIQLKQGQLEIKEVDEIVTEALVRSSDMDESPLKISLDNKGREAMVRLGKFIEESMRW